MPRNIGFSITGKNINSTISLKGNTNNDNSTQIPLEIKNIKIMIMNLIIVPFIAKQWKKLEENICFIDILTEKLNLYLSIYSNNEYLLLYKDLLFAFETAIFQHMEIRNLEKYFTDENSDSVTTLVFKTTMIRLKPEYELYNLIIGKPNLICGEKYNELIIIDILQLLKINTVNYDIIKKYIQDKYCKL